MVDRNGAEFEGREQRYYDEKTRERADQKRKTVVCRRGREGTYAQKKRRGRQTPGTRPTSDNPSALLENERLQIPGRAGLS